MMKRQQQLFGEVKEKTSSGNIKEIIAKLSRGIMLPIAMLPIAGLALGIGATVSSQWTSDVGQVFGNMIMLPGSIIFTILPLLFAIAIAITFTSDSGVAGLSATIGWFVLIVIPSAFIIFPTGTDANYHYIWYTFGQSQFDSIFTDVFGIKILSTSIFGGIIVGAITAFLYNKYKNIQLPKMIGFFSGVRFIPIVTFGCVAIASLVLAMVWPLIGMGIYYLGIGLSYGGKYGGVTSLFYGFFNRSLVPLGLHHCLNVPLWFTNVGGSLNTADVFYVWDGTSWSDTSQTWWELAGAAHGEIIQGDINIQIYLTRIIGRYNSDLGHVIRIQDLTDSYNYYHSQILNDQSIFAPGQYTNFAYVFCLFGLPGAAIAMVMSAPKGESRKLAFSVVIPSAVVSTLTGTTEPIEFTFLFLAPWLYFGFHAIMAGVAAMITTTLNYYAPAVAPHVGFSFSSGTFDFIIYGLIPDARGGGTHCWMLLILSGCFFPIYYFIFMWAIKRWNLKTPGRDGATKLFTKADWVKKHDGQKPKASTTNTMKQKAMNVIEAYGGPENIKNIDACLTKLRIQVNDKIKVNHQKLKDLGALGIVSPSAQSVYAVFGTEADIIKNNMKEIIAKKEYQSTSVEENN